MSDLHHLYPSKCQTPLLQLQYKEKQEVKKSSKERWSKMTTLTITKCVEHNPMKSAISEIGDEQFTFCQDCENNIERWYNDTDPERLPMWTDWKVSK
jgi:hypothetical protein